MGWRFRRSIKIAPGVRVNIGKTGLTSVSVGGRGARLTFGKRGVTQTLGIPGTGLSHSTHIGSAQLQAASTPTAATGNASGFAIVGTLVCFVALATGSRWLAVIALGAVIAHGLLGKRDSQPSPRYVKTDVPLYHP